MCGRIWTKSPSEPYLYRRFSERFSERFSFRPGWIRAMHGRVHFRCDSTALPKTICRWSGQGFDHLFVPWGPAAPPANVGADEHPALVEIVFHLAAACSAAPRKSHGVGAGGDPECGHPVRASQIVPIRFNRTWERGGGYARGEDQSTSVSMSSSIRRRSRRRAGAGAGARTTSAEGSGGRLPEDHGG